MNIEKDLQVFCYQFMEKMGWKPFPVNRVKVSKMARYKGLCITEDCESVYIILSEITNDSNKDFFATLIHELIHAHLLINKKVFQHHKHGKRFKQEAKKVQKKTKGFYTIKEIV